MLSETLCPTVEKKTARFQLRLIVASLVAAFTAGVAECPFDGSCGALIGNAVAAQDKANEGEGERHYREGNQVRDRQARFIVAGDRVEFHPSDGHDPLLVLENLALERVKNEVVRVGSGVRWDVIALVTEYEGDNYVLIQRASISITSELDE